LISRYELRLAILVGQNTAGLPQRQTDVPIVDRIRVPLLDGQGGNDPRVMPKEPEQIVAAIDRNGGKVTYVLYPDEGHGFARPSSVAALTG